MDEYMWLQCHIVKKIKEIRHSKIAVGVLASYINTAVGILSNFILIPIYLKYLGREEYGLWLAVSGVVTYLGFINFGIIQTTTNLFGKAVATQDEGKQSAILATGFWLYLKTVTIALLILLVTTPWVPWHYLIKGSTGVQDLTKVVLITASAAFLVELPFKIFAGCLQNIGKIHWQQITATSQSIARLFVAFMYLCFGGGLVGLIIVLSITNMLTHVVNFIMLKRELPYLSISKDNFDILIRNEMKGPSLYYLLLQISGAVLFSTDALVISAKLGAGSVAPYSIAQRIAYIGMIITNTTSINYGPSFIKAYAQHDFFLLRSLFRKSLLLSVGIGGLVSVTLLLIGPFFIPLWVGEENYVGFSCYAVIISLLFVQMVLLPAEVLLTMTGNHKKYALFYMWEALLNLSLSLVLVLQYGVIGVAMGTLIARFLGAGPIMLLETYKLLKIDVTVLCKDR